MIGLLDAPADRRIQMHADSDVERQHRLGACAKEPWTAAWIEQMQPGDVLYDIGANVGSYTLLAASRGVNVVAFEPGPAHYARLCQNVALNGLQNQVIPFLVALGRHERLEMLPQAEQAGYSGGPTLMCTPVMRLDEVVRTWNLPVPTHIKLDVDGAEPQVLAGAHDVLRGTRSVMVELGHPRDAQVVALLEAADLVAGERWASTTTGSGVCYTLYTRP